MATNRDAADFVNRKGLKAVSRPTTLLLVTGDGCDAADADYPSYRDAVAALRDACTNLGPDTWFSEPVDGHGIIYTLTVCGRTGKPELWTDYRYLISDAAGDDE